MSKHVDNMGATDRWQDPRDLSGGATDSVPSHEQRKCDNVHLPHANGGTDHGPVAFVRGGKLLCSACTYEKFGTLLPLGERPKETDAEICAGTTPSTTPRSDACRAALANIMARIDVDEFIPTEYKEDARAALATDCAPSTSDDVIHTIVDWRGLIASKDGGSRVTLGDAISVGDQLVSALIEETGRRKRAEILLQAMNGHYVRSAIAMFTPTHRHADGGLYRLVTGSRYKTAREDEWSDCIIYEAQDRKLYVTTPARWTDRFTALEAQ